MVRTLSALRVAGLCLALVALALRVAVPAGFMLEQGESNRLTIVLCSGTGPVTAEMDLATGEIHTKPTEKGGDKGKADAPCAFAGIAVAALTPNDVALSVPVLQSVAAGATPLDARPALVPAGPPLPARGPPTFA